MRIAIAGFHIESASFLPQASTLEDFEAATTRGHAIIGAYAGTNTVVGGALDVCRQAGVEAVPLVYSFLGALGPATDEAVEAFAEEIARSVQLSGTDGVLLHLHGASWAPSYPDAEKMILDHVRSVVGEKMPIVVCYDYHGNLDESSIEGANAAFAYRHSPHTDTGQTGRRGATCLLAILASGMRPGLAIEKPGLIVPSIFSATALSPLKDIIADARTAENEAGYFLDISIMAGFSYADAPNTGFSVMVVSERGKTDAARVAQRFSRRIFDQREAIYRPEPVYTVTEGVTRAMAQSPAPGRPVVLLEHADRMNDSTYVLAELVARDAQRAYVPFLWDNQAAVKASEAGVGAQISLTLGAWSSDRAGPRQTYSCEVLDCGVKSYQISGRMMTGHTIDLGPTALLRIGGVTVSVVSNFAFTVDGDIYAAFGKNISDFDIVVLRSKTHFRDYFEPRASDIILVDTPDHGRADLRLLPYRHLDRHSVYPLNAAPAQAG